jgi:hypothetical protein
MEKIPFKTNKDDRVRIKADATSVYPKARAYMEGWVRRQTRDELGYPLIYVEWDKDHWAYSGESNGWAMESHFDLVQTEENMADEKKYSQDEIADILAKVLNEVVPRETDVKYDGGSPEPSEDLAEDTYEESVQKAFQVASEGEAFFLFVAKKEGTTNVAYIPYSFSDARDHQSPAVPLLEATLSDVGAQAHAASAFREIRQMTEEGNDTPKAR